MTSKLENIIAYKPLSVWFIGLPCSGKTTLSQGVHASLQEEGLRTNILDGDDLRKGINSNLTFSLSDRLENIRRVAEINKLFLKEGYIILNALICPLSDMRRMIANIVGKEYYCEIFVNAPLNICEERDIKGMYRKARAGEIHHFTGIDSPFEPPVHPDVNIRTDQVSIQSSIDSILRYIKPKIMIN